jgi:3-deoxy-manno-octulosonate cytidylyltransferase (CMP-KDO synthetase)
LLEYLAKPTASHFCLCCFDELHNQYFRRTSATTMNTIAMIPARLEATRFPRKLMQLLGDKTIILHTYDNAVATGLFDDVIVATDSDIIYREITGNGGKAVMSRQLHESGSDRIAEAIEHMDIEVVVNVQGDEPFVQKEMLEKVLQQFEGEDGAGVQVASIMQLFKDPELMLNPNNVKVVVNKRMNAMLFSRSVIPYQRDRTIQVPYYHHIGVYAYRKQALLNFTQWPVTPLEAAEKLEGNRYLENGVPIRMVLTEYKGIGIDAPDDLERAKAYLASMK